MNILFAYLWKEHRITSQLLGGNELVLIKCFELKFIPAVSIVLTISRLTQLLQCST